MPQERSVLSVRIDSNLIADLREFADRHGVPLSRLVEDALQQALRGRQRVRMGTVDRDLQQIRHLRNAIAHSASPERRKRELRRLIQRRSEAMDRLKAHEARLAEIDEQFTLISETRASIQKDIDRSELEAAALERQLILARENHQRAENQLADLYVQYRALTDERDSLQQFLSEIEALAETIPSSLDLGTGPATEGGDKE